MGCMAATQPRVADENALPSHDNTVTECDFDTVSLQIIYPPMFNNDLIDGNVLIGTSFSENGLCINKHRRIEMRQRKTSLIKFPIAKSRHLGLGMSILLG